MATDSPAPRTYKIGSFTVLAIGGLLLVDLILPWLFRSLRDEVFLIGLSFGQIGAAVMWICAARSLSWQRLAICYGIVLLMAGHYIWWIGYLYDPDEMAMILTIWAIPATLALGVHTAWRWLMHRHHAAIENGTEPPRFGVRHLIIATTVLAVASLVVRIAMPELSNVFDADVILLILQTAALYIVALTLARTSLHLLGKLGILAAAGLAATFAVALGTDLELIVGVNIPLVAILALFLIAPVLDRYTMHVHFEPREEESPEPTDTMSD